MLQQQIHNKYLILTEYFTPFPTQWIQWMVEHHMLKFQTPKDDILDRLLKHHIRRSNDSIDFSSHAQG